MSAFYAYIEEVRVSLIPGEYKIEEYLDGHAVMFYGELANVPYNSVRYYSNECFYGVTDSYQECVDWANAREVKIAA